MRANQISLSTKILGLCLFLASVSVIIAGISYRGLTGTAHTYASVTEVAMPKVNSLNSLYLTYQAIRISLRTLGIPNLSATESERAVSAVKRSIAEYERLSLDYLKVDFLEGEEALYNPLRSAWTDFKAIGVRALEANAEGTPAGRARLIEIFLVDCPRAAGIYDEAIDRLKKFQLSRAAGFVTDAKSQAESANRIVFFTALAGILSGLAAGYFFARSISKSISKITDELASSSEELDEATQSIDSSAVEMAAAAASQATSIEATAAALEEISAMIAKATESAAASADRSAESQARAESGKLDVVNMIRSMEEISESNAAIVAQVNQGNDQMALIAKVIEDIANKTKVINEIVFQTKLLSFNASVEAARAGEHGKGFAVVAEEVGNLARMSGNASKEISDMLTSSIETVNGIIKTSGSAISGRVVAGKSKVDEGTRVALQCSDSLSEIVTNVTLSTNLATEISKACLEQSAGVREITKTMATLDTLTQANALSSKATARASKELAVQSKVLRGNVRSLVLTVKGKVDSAAPPATAKRGSGQTKDPGATPSALATNPTTIASSAASQSPSRDSRAA